MQVGFQLAPGMGDILPGMIVLPQNPVQSAMRVPTIGQLMPGKFTVPQNPLLDALSRTRLSGCGCNGMGALDLSSMTSSVTSWASAQPWTTWAMVGGALVLVMFFSGRGSSSSAYRADKKEAMAKLRAKYPGRGRRMLSAAA